MDIAIRVLLEAPVGVDVELERSGSSLENPYVYDAVARALAARADGVALEVRSQESAPVAGDLLITRFRFRRLR